MKDRCNECRYKMERHGIIDGEDVYYCDICGIYQSYPLEEEEEALLAAEKGDFFKPLTQSEMVTISCDKCKHEEDYSTKDLVSFNEKGFPTCSNCYPKFNQGVDKPNSYSIIREHSAAEKKNCGCGKDPCVTYGAESEKKPEKDHNCIACGHHSAHIKMGDDRFCNDCYHYAETFNAENSDAMKVIIKALDTIKYPDIDDDSYILDEVKEILEDGADEDDDSKNMNYIFMALNDIKEPDMDDDSYILGEVKGILQRATSKSAETFEGETDYDDYIDRIFTFIDEKVGTEYFPSDEDEEEVARFKKDFNDEFDEVGKAIEDANDWSWDEILGAETFGADDYEAVYDEMESKLRQRMEDGQRPSDIDLSSVVFEITNDAAGRSEHYSMLMSDGREMLRYLEEEEDDYGVETFKSYKVAPELSSYTVDELVDSIAGPQGSAAYDEMVYDPIAQDRQSAESFSLPHTLLLLGGIAAGLGFGVLLTKKLDGLNSKTSDEGGA